MGAVSDYTDRQKKILDGSIPIDKVKDATLNRLLKRAIQINDTDTVKAVGHWLAIREEHRLPDYSGYTEKQQAVLSGKISPDEVTGQLAGGLLKRATQLNDEKVIAIAKELVAKSHERHMEKDCERAKARRQKVKNNVYEWKQPKASDYSEHHIKVIRGEIPLEKVATKELISIHMIAKKKGDIELSERILNLIIDRRQACIDRETERFAELKKQGKTFSDNAGRSENKLSRFERSILRLEADMNDVSEEILEHIIYVCKRNSDDHGVHIAELLLQYKKHPESVYPTQDNDEAIDMIEEMIGKPIRRPETWFI